MSTRKRRLGTRSQIVTEIERLYTQVSSFTEDDLDTKSYLQTLTRLLDLAIKVADDSDVLGAVRALEAKILELETDRGSPRASVTSIDARRPGRVA